MNCASCGAANPQGKRFCADCGTLLAAACPACGCANQPSQKFCGDCGQALTEGSTRSPPSTDTTRPIATSEPAAERRQLTVMFCDLVGSSALANRADPEETRGVLRGFHAAVAAAVTPFEGHVAQLLGDGVLVYFGYPRAHEDDPSRAVRAALAVLPAVAALEASGSSGPLQTRIGIATGLVVIGQIGEGTPANEHSASGETPNLAARLQALAAPGEIVLSENTRQLLDASFELTALGPQTLKGFDAPCTLGAWQASEGALLLQRTTPDAVGAERSFENALEVAREQGAKSFELRAATSLATLWHEQGKRNEARELLGGVYAWFTEGFDTPDLRRAKALLDEWANG